MPKISGRVREDQFVSPTVGKLDLNQMIEAICQFLFAEPQASYRLVIGSDSQEYRYHRQKICNFITAIVVHRLGKGGRYFWQNGLRKPVYSLRQKIYTETTLSLQTAEQVVPRLRQQLNGQNNWQLEIHIDVGKSGETRDMIKEVIGMVTGYGYTCKTKPEAYAAQTIADKHA